MQTVWIFLDCSNTNPSWQQKYQLRMYPQNIKLTTDSLIFSKGNEHLQLLLIERGFVPFKGMWAFPGGYVEDYEDLEESALRELHEETGLKLSGMTQLHTFATPGRDPRGRTASVVYY